MGATKFIPGGSPLPLLKISDQVSDFSMHDHAVL